MDAARFDALTKTLGTPRSRRSLARLLGGLSLGGVLSALTVRKAAAAKLNGGARCSSKTQCKSGRCLNPDKCDCTKKSCKCICACSTTDPVVRCIAPPNPCKKAVCSATGRCVLQNKQNGISCGAGKVCYRGTCCSPNCAGKKCGPNGCGGSCGPCFGGFCSQTGVCDCGPGKELCQGVCVGTCTSIEIRKPGTCDCCCTNGFMCDERDTPCCSGIRNAGGNCTGRSSGALCSFDAQCASGECQDGTCTCDGDICPASAALRVSRHE